MNEINLSDCVTCPGCRADLAKDDSVELWLSIRGSTYITETCVNPNGFLIDPEGSPIKSGYVADIYCANCCEDLTNKVIVWPPDGISNQINVSIRSVPSCADQTRHNLFP
jgi:hypothetical protein